MTDIRTNTNTNTSESGANEPPTHTFTSADEHTEMHSEIPSRMQAVRLHAYGGSSAVMLEEVPVSLPGEGEVLVKVQAAAINPMDWKLREGHLKEFFPLEFPTGLGSDFAGVVATIGQGVTAFKPGDRVYGVADMARGGAFAEYAIAKVEAISLRPRLLTAVESTSVPVVALTAWEAIHEVGKVKPSSKVMVHGAAGMVGRFAIQFLHRLHCHVVALTDHKHVHLVRELGATTVFDYERAPFEEYISGIEFVLDTIGGEIRDRSWGTLLRGGVLVSLTDMPSQEMAAKYGVRAEAMQMHPSPAHLADIARLLDAGELVTFVGKVYPFAQVADAVEAQKEHKAEGKIVLELK